VGQREQGLVTLDSTPWEWTIWTSVKRGDGKSW
jgi:hypothetical protein